MPILLEGSKLYATNIYKNKTLEEISAGQREPRRVRARWMPSNDGGPGLAHSPPIIDLPAGPSDSETSRQIVLVLLGQRRRQAGPAVLSCVGQHEPRRVRACPPLPNDSGPWRTQWSTHHGPSSRVARLQGVRADRTTWSRSERLPPQANRQRMVKSLSSPLMSLGRWVLEHPL